MVSVQSLLCGVAWPTGAGVAYPRADPTDSGRLPADTWATATIPVGVRIEVVGDASALDVHYRTDTDDLGYRGSGAGTTFEVWRNGELIDSQPAVVGDGIVRLQLGRCSGRAIVYLPEGMKPTILSIAGVGGTIEAPPPWPRWVAYGDSIAEGWIASGPSGAWPAIAARRHDLDVVNLGYAGSARGEIVSAEHIAKLGKGAGPDTRVDVISITHGTNCWTRIPHSAEQMAANTRAFLRIVRAGHLGVPIVVASPIVRPDGETTPNVLGATHADIRSAMEDATQRLIDDGDGLITLIPGRDLLDPSLLGDGVHPNDAGHTRLADVFGAAVAAALSQVRK